MIPDPGERDARALEHDAREWTCPHGRTLMIGHGIPVGGEACLCDANAARAAAGPAPPMWGAAFDKQ